jgi:hypothetical protein
MEGMTGDWDWGKPERGTGNGEQELLVEALSPSPLVP